MMQQRENKCSVQLRKILKETKASERLSIKSLILLALDSTESGWCEEDGDKEELAQRAVEILLVYSPKMLYLPLYMLRLATDVEWEEEEKCFETFRRETAHYYPTVLDADIKDDRKRHR
uniref:DNA mismatch repair protein Mlh1 C-terminal domain-containing protein n=1 Tax=Glossina palpalis gambiensis TaxID=67801 RepID=A0A1B0B2G2_9MUSC